MLRFGSFSVSPDAGRTEIDDASPGMVRHFVLVFISIPFLSESESSVSVSSGSSSESES